MTEIGCIADDYTGGTDVAAGLRRAGLRVAPCRARTWRRMTAVWEGVHADALLSHGFLRHYAWTLDFDHYTYRFAP